MLGTFDFKLINFPFSFFIERVVEVAAVAVWACCFLFERKLEARLTKVLHTAFCEVRVTKNFVADTAVELSRYWLGECKIIAIISSHFDLECTLCKG